MKPLLFEFAKVTEMAALAGSEWIGRGRKNEADDAATTAMRQQLSRIECDGVIIIGEGELDEAPMLYIGERVGTGRGVQLDIAVDPLEGTSLIACGEGNSIAVIAAAPRGTLLHAPDMYMKKIAVGPRAAGTIHIEAPLVENMANVARALGKQVDQLTIMVQDRERHADIIREILDAGARVRLFKEGDVLCAITPCFEKTGVDMFIGIGGAPEGVLSAVAIKVLGGDMQGQLIPGNEGEYARCGEFGMINPEEALPLGRLVGSDDLLFAATGVTDGLFLKGVSAGDNNKKIVNSLLICSDMESKDIRFVDAHYA
jgi:fructose-1,6-bisphosphatase II